MSLVLGGPRKIVESPPVSVRLLSFGGGGGRRVVRRPRNAVVESNLETRGLPPPVGLISLVQRVAWSPVNAAVGSSRDARGRRGGPLIDAGDEKESGAGCSALAGSELGAAGGGARRCGREAPCGQEAPWPESTSVWLPAVPWAAVRTRISESGSGWGGAPVTSVTSTGGLEAPWTSETRLAKTATAGVILRALIKACGSLPSPPGVVWWSAVYFSAGKDEIYSTSWTLGQGLRRQTAVGCKEDEVSGSN